MKQVTKGLITRSNTRKKLEDWLMVKAASSAWVPALVYLVEVGPGKPL